MFEVTFPAQHYSICIVTKFNHNRHPFTTSHQTQPSPASPAQHPLPPLPHTQKSPLTQIPKLGKLLAPNPSQNINILLRQLERGKLKAQTRYPARCIRKHEPKVNVDQVARCVEEDVAVVAGGALGRK